LQKKNEVNLTYLHDTHVIKIRPNWDLYIKIVHVEEFDFWTLKIGHVTFTWL